MDKKNQIKFYTDILKENEILLLKSNDSFFNCHYASSPLNLLTNFSGTAGEAIIDKNGKIKLFVDSRYHILAQKQAFCDIEIYKMPLGESFIEAFEKNYEKGTILYLPSDISLDFYLKLDKYFDLRTYKLDKKFLKNDDFNKKEKIFKVDDKISQNNFEYKVNKLKKIHQNIDKMLVFNLDEISYLTNLRSFENKYSSNFKSVLYLDFKNSDYILFLDKKTDIKIEKLKFEPLDNFSDFIKSKDSEIYLDIKNVTLENYLSIKKPKVLKANSLALLASIKTKSEIEHLKDSSKKLDIAIYNFKKRLKAGLSEYDLVNIFEEELIKAGAKCPSFKTLLALDENSASIHYSTYDKNKILTGENILLLDCGGYYEAGLATDITRTFYFGMYPKNIHKKIYTKVLKAFIQAFNLKNQKAFELDKLARNILKEDEKQGFFFGHGLGHGIGTSVHQSPPLVNFISKDEIKPYQVHSIEPGLYGKDKDNVEFGIRIENCVYQDINYERYSLSNFPFEEILIDYGILNTNEIEFVKNWQNNNPYLI